MHFIITLNVERDRKFNDQNVIMQTHLLPSQLQLKKLKKDNTKGNY